MYGATDETTSGANDEAAPDGDPMGGMDPEMAANPQPTYKMLRDEMPVMPVEGLGVVLTRKAGGTAREFYAFSQGPAARAIFKRYGLLLAGDSATRAGASQSL